MDEQVSVVMDRMRSHGLRMLPVLDEQQRIQGVLSTYSVLSHILPDYIANGDLGGVSYASDSGLLHKHYQRVAAQAVSVVMDLEFHTVDANESLISVASTLIGCKHEYALVIDKDSRLLGVISAGDVIRMLSTMSGDERSQS